MNNLNSRLIPHAQKTGGGFTLVEILIGITLGLFLTAGMFQLFVANKQTYELQQESLRALDEVGFALGEISSNARMAGFTGCPVSVVPTNVLKKDTTATPNDWLWWYNLGDKDTPPAVVNGIRGHSDSELLIDTETPETAPDYDSCSYNGLPELKEGGVVVPPVDEGVSCADAPGVAVPGTDAVVFLGGGGGMYGVTANDTTANPKTLTLTTLDKSDGSQLVAGNIMIMCNGINAELFQVTSVDTSTRKIGYAGDTTMTPSNDSTKLEEITNNFLPPDAGVTYTSITDFTPVAFYLGTKASGEISLYQSRLAYKSADSQTGTRAYMKEEELVRGVSSMNILYGVDTVTTDDTTPNDPTPRYIATAYRAADAVTDWQRVTTVRITLSLTNSSQPVTTIINIRNRSL